MQVKTRLVLYDGTIIVKESLESIAYRIRNTEEPPFIQLHTHKDGEELVMNINHIKYMYKED